MAPYPEFMKARLTSKGQITIPVQIRNRLRLAAGQELEFDETVPYLKATKVVNRAEMRSTLGCLRESVEDVVTELDSLRGPVDLP